jgi:integrase
MADCAPFLHDPDDRPLSIKEAAAALGVSQSTMYKLIKEERIQVDRSDDQTRVPAWAIDRYMANPDRSKRAKRRSSSSRRSRPEGTRAPNGESSIYYSDSDKLWHAWVTVGVKDDGSLDRRHRKGKDEKALRRRVNELVQARGAGHVAKTGSSLVTTEQWLKHWVENVAALKVRPSTLAGYRVAVFHHLIPNTGKHRLEKIEPEHFEALYRKLLQAGSKPATVHQVHRTARTAFGVAYQRRLIPRNPVALATPPTVDEIEIDPYTLEEVERILMTALKRRNGFRWVLALIFGFRQGEALGFQWSDFRIDDEHAGNETIYVRRNRLRPTYSHGCSDPCGKKWPGLCPQRVELLPKTGPVKSKAAERPFPVPRPIVFLARVHREAQRRERLAAGPLWIDEGWVIATETGDAVNPRTDWDDWKKLLKAAGVRDARLHDARHTAATLALLAGVLDRTAQVLFGWATAKNGERYRHVTRAVQRDAADRLEALVWSPRLALESGAETHNTSAATSSSAPSPPQPSSSGSADELPDRL